MYIEEVVGIIPLIKEELSNNRYEIHELMIKRILSSKKENEIISTSSIKKEIIQKFNIEDFPAELLSNILSSLVTEKHLKLNEDGTYKITNQFKYQNISTLIDECYKEFTVFADNSMNNFDIFLCRNFKGAFEDSLYEMINIFIEKDEFYNHQIENVNLNEVEASLINIASNNVENPKQFVNLFFNFINSHNVKINEFLFLAYRGAITYDILRRGHLLSQKTIEIGKGGLLLLDTNTIISLICKTDRTHKLAESTISLSKKLKFDICYTKKTADEYSRLLNAADYHMKAKRFFKTKNVVDNQLINDFIKQNEGSWSDYYLERSNIELYLKAKYDIQLFEASKLDLDQENEIIQYIDIVYNTVLHIHFKEKNKDTVDHDIYLLKLAVLLSENEPEMVFNCPWILSYDSILNSVNDLVIKRFDKLQYGFIIHPQTWLNTLLVFSNVEIDEEKREDIVKAIINYMIFPVKNVLTLEQYAKLITYKLGLSEENEEFIKYLLTMSPLKRNLDIALKNNDVDKVSEITNEILTDSDLIEKAISEGNTKKENERLQNQLKNLAENNRAEKIKNELLEKVVFSQNINNEIIIENTDPNISKIYSVLLNKIESVDHDFFEKNKIEINGQEKISKGSAIETLKKIRSVINEGKYLVQDIKDLLKYVPTIMSLINN